jgi:hypothetical protein
MTRLNQIIALAKDAKGQGETSLTKGYHELQKTQLLSGLSRVYAPVDEEGDKLPPESTRVQIRTDEVIKTVTTRLTRMFDVVATQENANTNARASVIVDGDTLLPDVPVVVLIFLEKQLDNLMTFIRKLPTLDPSEEWVFSESVNAYATIPAQTTRTKKVPRNHVRAPATDKHPAQVDMWYEDVLAGTWTIVKFSGALPASRVAELVGRVERLQQAVTMAREEANSIEVTDVHIGRQFFEYLFA